MHIRIYIYSIYIHTYIYIYKGGRVFRITVQEALNLPKMDRSFCLAQRPLVFPPWLCRTAPAPSCSYPAPPTVVI